MKLTRRKAIKLGLVSPGILLSPWAIADPAAADCLYESCMKMSEEKLPPNPQIGNLFDKFQDALPIPEPLTKEIHNHGIDYYYYQITMRKEKVTLGSPQKGLPPVRAEFWTYNGSIPGPLIRQPKNVPSCIRFINELGNDAQGNPICNSVHLHGMASLPQYDGYAEDLIQPNYYKDYYYPNNRASILWYHDHAVHKTSRNVYMGLAGMYIVEYGLEDFCENPANYPLPKDKFEIPLILQDKTFEIPDPNQPTEWKLVFDDRPNHRGIYANLLLVNGKPWPYLKVKRQKYYFRLLNASASRTYQLTLSNSPESTPGNTGTLTHTGKPAELVVIGSDAGLLAHPVPLSAPNKPLRMGVAERYGIVIDFAQFRPEIKQVYLRNLPFPSNPGPDIPVVMRFDLDDEVVEDPIIIPDDLGIVTPRDAMIQRAVPQRQTFRFGKNGNKWTINGRTWNREKVEAQPTRCDIQIWELVNAGGWTHPVHIHLVDFQILSRNGRKPLPYEMGWKDVVLLSDFEKVEVIARYAPHRGKYMIHCHNIVHEDHDMMAQFEVVDLDAQGKAIIEKDKDGNDINAPWRLDPPKQIGDAKKLGSEQPPDKVKQLPLPCSELPRPSTCPLPQNS
jgi:spore coat protein A, manganese oxidase